jgi:hypothetical protein
MINHSRWFAFRFIIRSVYLASLILLASILSFAQMESATMSGTVLDRSGAVVADAKIEVTNSDTNVKNTTTTNRSGTFVVTGLRPGRYRMSVSKEGFRSIVVTDITLNVQDVVSRNFNLDVGAFSESITVTADQININTTDATVSTVVDRQFAENLPMNGRSFQTLIQLTPGIVVTASNSSDNGQFTVNGQRAASNYWMVDGVSANIGIGPSSPSNGYGGTLGSFSASGGTNSLVSVDALQEFRIQTSTYAPEFGRTPGGQISISTRSGTDQLHGTLFDYLRNDALDANNWFNGFTNSPPLPKAEERQNDFGGTLGGPILKDRSFFFFSYEGLRLRLPQTALTTVPCDSSCAVFGNARATAASAMQPFLNAYPLPNGPEVFTPCTPNVNGCPSSGEMPTGAGQFNGSFSTPASLDAYSLRVDHKFNGKIALFGRYNYSPSDVQDRGGSEGGDALSVVELLRITTQTATLGFTWSVLPEMTNDMRFNYSRVNANSSFKMDNFGGAVPLQSLPFPSSFTSQNAQLSLQTIGLTNGTFALGKSAKNLQRQVNIVDSLSLQKGSHSFKFGVDFRHLSPVFGPTLYEQQVFFFGVPNLETGNLCPFCAQVVGSIGASFLLKNLGLYAQDTWRAAPRVTITYGIRWDLDFVPSTTSGPNIPAVTGFNLANLTNLAVAPAGTSPFRTTYGNIAPRIGLAYQLSQSQSRQTVLRGGFGVFYDLASSEFGNLISSRLYPFGNVSFNGGTFPFAPVTVPPPPIIPPGSTGTLLAIDPNLKLPYTLEWNVALQQALSTQQSVSLSYIGASGRRLLQSTSVFPPAVNFGNVGVVSNTGSSNYNALQVQFERRLADGLQALASYTFSHSIDTSSAGSTGVASNTFVPGLGAANRGDSDFDIRHSFSAGVTYDIPTPRLTSVAKALLQGWSLENVVQARSAPPVNVFSLLFGAIVNNAFTEVRPNLVSGIPLYLYGPQYPGGKALNNTPNQGGLGCIGPFCAPPPGQQGNLGRNALRGFGATQWDLAVHRDFPIRESVKLQFRAEMFNLLNHPNFGPPDADLLDPTFGTSTQMLGQSLNSGNTGGGALNPLYQIGGPRSIQFALKLFF